MMLSMTYTVTTTHRSGATSVLTADTPEMARNMCRSILSTVDWQGESRREAHYAVADINASGGIVGPLIDGTTIVVERAEA